MKLIKLFLFILLVGFWAACGSDDGGGDMPGTMTLNASFSIADGPYYNKTDIQFTNNSTAATSYFWEFGDGNTSTLKSPTHSFAAEGNYIVELTAFDDDGGSDISSKPLTVEKNSDLLVVAIAGETSIIYGEEFLLSANGSGGYTSLSWDMGDGTTYDKFLIAHRYNSPGSYTVTLEASDGVNTKSATKTIVASVKNEVWKISLSGLAMAHGSGVGGDDDGVWGLIEFDVVELNASGQVTATVNSFSNLWEKGESGRVQATGYPANNGVIGNINLARNVTLDKTKWNKGRYRLDYTTKFTVRHRDCGLCTWGTVSMGTEQTKSFIIGNPGVEKCELFQTNSDAGRVHFFRPQFNVVK